MLSSETKRRIDSCRDILVGQLPLPTDQVELITLALIYKFMDDLDEQSVQLGGKRSFFIKDLADFRWRSLMPQTVSAADRVRLFADGLEALGDPKTGKHLPEMFRDIFRNAMLKFRDGRILNLFLTELDGFAYSHSEELGNAFEYLLQSMGAQGDNGQFRTPRHIIDFIVEVLEPKPEDKILDPACGTGGFLVSAYKHILGKHTSKGSSVPGDQLSPAKKEKLTQHLNGYDITPMMVKLSKVNMFLHGFSDPQIHEYDTLSNDARWNEKYDLIMANPPFMTPKGGVVPHTKFRIAAKKAEVLFTDYIAEHLTTNGRAGIIVPEGIIFQSGTAYKALRKFLVEDSLVAVIALPSGVFNPYSGVKTSILILDKGLARQSDSIAFFKVENDGYDLGAQRRAIDKNDLPRLTQEIHEYLEKLRSGKKAKETENMQIVPKEKIAANGEYNLGGVRYREVVFNSFKWPQLELRSLVKIESGSRQKGGALNAGMPSIGGEQIDEKGEIRFHKMKYISETHFKEMTKGVLKKNDTLIVKDGATTGKTGLYKYDLPAAVNEHVFILRAQEQIDPFFLYRCIRAHGFQVRLKPYIKGIIGGISLEFADIQIPLPPLEIQKEIVAEIEGYQKVIDGARAVVENYKPQIPIDPEWPMKTLEELCEIQRGRFSHRPRNDPKFYDGEYPFIQTGDIVRAASGEKISFSQTLNKTGLAVSKLFEPPIVLITIAANIGDTAVLDFPSCFPDSVVGLTPKLGVDVRYLEIAMRTQKEHLNKIAPQSAQKNINIEILKEVTLPVPPPETQKLLVEEIEKEQAMVNANKELIARFEKKIQTVMDRVWGNGTAD